MRRGAWCRGGEGRGAEKRSAVSEADLSRRGCGAVWAPHLLLSGEQETMGPTGEALLSEEIIHALGKTVLHRQPLWTEGARRQAQRAATPTTWHTGGG
jgi:hypothetical protein